MTTISNVDLVMAALRARLQRLAKDKRTESKARAARADSAELAGPQPDPANLAGLAPQQFDQELVRALLQREFGGAIAGHPRFTMLMERTAALLRSDPEIEALLRRLQSEQTS